ncbi:MAG: hypothetical protein ABSH51_07940 [Solirubrobacteraceae bacterium]
MIGDESLEQIDALTAETLAPALIEQRPAEQRVAAGARVIDGRDYTEIGRPPSQRRRRRWLPSVGVMTGPLPAVVIGMVFAAALHTRATSPTGTRGPGNTGTGFPGAPRTQANGDGVATGVCPLAAPNRYLPPRSGCLTVRRADIAADGRQDLVLLYSRLSHERAGQLGLGASLSKMYVATSAMLRVVQAGGGIATVRVDGARAAAIVALAHVNDDPGDELLIQVSQISSGATAVAYGLRDGRLIPAGVTLSYGGDSAGKAGFDCLTGHPARLVQRTFELIGPTIYAWWNETDTTYAWHGPHLIKIAERTFKRRGLPPGSETEIGAGCITGTGG